MKKKQTAPIFISLLIGLVLAVGLSYVAADWSNPGGNPPTINQLIPINATTNDQVKVGGLTVGTLLVSGDATVDQITRFGGQLFGFTQDVTVPTTLRIGGALNSTNPDDPDSYKVSLQSNGYVKANQSLGSDELKSDQKYRLCADDHGHIVFCPKYAEYTGPVHAQLHISYGPTYATNSFYVSMDKPISQNIVITKVFTDGYPSTNCTGSAIASAQQNSPQTLPSGQYTMSFTSQSTTGDWTQVKNETTYNFMINGQVVNNGQTLNFGNDTVTFNFPPCSQK